MRVLILPDEPTWIINRITDRMIAGMPEIRFTKRFYIGMPADELVRLANEHDLVHYQNWVLAEHVPALDQISAPFLMSIRSHRFQPHTHEVAKRVDGVHVVSPELQREFAGSFYIPDAIDDMFFQPFRVGYAGQPSEYKGVYLIDQACRELGVEFRPAFSLPFDQMPDYYRSINVLVCASVAEGFCAPVVEALAMGVPVITTDVGIARELNIPKIARSVDGIKAGIRLHYHRPEVEPYRWPEVCGQFRNLYERLVAS